MEHPNAKYDHVYAIIRVDNLCLPNAVAEEAVTIKKIVWSKEEAESEVKRLNKLNNDKDSVYFWQVTRLERLPVTQRV